MFNQYFGQYLLKKQILTAEQLHDVLVHEHLARPKLGVLAIDAGHMTAEEVEEVNKLQHTMDKKFGEIAISRGYLTTDQLEGLLGSQQIRRLNLSQALIDKGYLTLAQLESALEKYKQDNRLTSGQLDSLYNADSGGIVRTFLDFSAAGPDADMLYNYVALVLRAILRFLSEEPIIDFNQPPAQGFLVSQNITGNVSLSTGLVMSDALLQEMASRYSGEKITAVNEFALDCISEFLNETNGIFAVNMSDQGLELDLEPPQKGKVGYSPAQGVFRIPLYSSDGLIDLYIALGAGKI
jgi:CheY-specific phosphatase CheX